MALKSAVEFIGRVRSDAEFRKSACKAGLDQSFPAWLKSTEYEFTPPEIWDAFRTMLLECRHEGEAGEVKELRMWYSLLSGEDEDACGSCAHRGGCGK